MFKPVKLKLKSTYKYVQLTQENLGTLYDEGYFNTTVPKETFLNRAKNVSKPLPCIKGCGDTACFPENYLVFQYDPTDTITGSVAFSTKEEMLEYFEETE